MDAVSVGLPVCQFNHVPSGLLQSGPEVLHRLLRYPTLIHLEGRVQEPLFVSVLLHGNETTGWRAVQRLLTRYDGSTLPRALSLFIGNVRAAGLGRRRLDDEVDFNRIWPGHVLTPSPETRMAEWVYQTMAQRRPFAAIDVHNNTGTNPHYACVDQLDPRTLHLASMFGRRCIHSTHPRGTLSAAFAELCPSVTLECGKPDLPLGIDHASEYLDACLRLSVLPSHPVHSHDLELYESVGQVLVRNGVRFGFDDRDAALNLIPDLDRWNFTTIPAGFALGYTDAGCLPLQVIDVWGRDIAGQFFAVEQECLVARRDLIPAMLTTDARIVRQDCLGYLMQRLT